MLKEFSRLSVAVLGAGPRALASAICMARHYRVALAEAVSYRSQKRLTRSPMYPGEPELDGLFRRACSNIEITESYSSALTAADVVIVAEQPIFQSVQRAFDMSAIESCLETVARRRPRATVILEAPTPVGYALEASLRHHIHVIPAPLHMREGFVARDRAQPQRVLVGDASERGLSYAFLAIRSCSDSNTPYLLTNSSEAEAIHAFERKRVLRGHSESHEEVIDYCLRHRLNENQVRRGLQTLDYVSESSLGDLYVCA